MILIDSSIWIDHLRAPESELAHALSAGMVWQHPFVTAELALGSLRDRTRIIALLGQLAAAPVMPHAALLRFIDEAALAGTGIGLVDGHLLAATCAAPAARLWTRDKRLRAQATRLGVAYLAA